MKVCKYYKPIMEHLVMCFGTFLGLDGCAAGGPLHILLDDMNYEDDDISFCYNYCNNNSKGLELELGKYICEKLFDLTMEERAVVLSYFCGETLDCELTDCSQCHLLADSVYINYMEKKNES